MNTLSDRVENIVGKKKMLVISQQCFQRPSLPGSLKMGLCCKELKLPSWGCQKLGLCGKG